MCITWGQQLKLNYTLFFSIIGGNNNKLTFYIFIKQ